MEAENRALTVTGNVMTALATIGKLSPEEAPELFTKLFASVKACEDGSDLVKMSDQLPAVDPNQSVTNDFIVCLDDGKRFRSLKRHLAKLGMTPDQYRAKWGLPSSYPMVAPSYAEKRSQMAKNMGLGRKPSKLAKAA